MARFAVYIGDLGSDTAARAREILAKVPTPNNAVLLAVSPDQCAIEVVYGVGGPRTRCRVGRPAGRGRRVVGVRAGHLIDGLVSAIRVLSAGSRRLVFGSPAPALDSPIAVTQADQAR